MLWAETGSSSAVLAKGRRPRPGALLASGDPPCSRPAGQRCVPAAPAARKARLQPFALRWSWGPGRPRRDPISASAPGPAPVAQSRHSSRPLLGRRCTGDPLRRRGGRARGPSPAAQPSSAHLAGTDGGDYQSRHASPAAAASSSCGAALSSLPARPSPRPDGTRGLLGSDKPPSLRPAMSTSALSAEPLRGPLAPAAAEGDELAEELMDGGGCGGDGGRPWTPQEKALHEARLKAKAKRRLRRTSSRDSARESLSEGGEPVPDPNSPPAGKSHDRRSRMGKGRGLPKKGGAGGKGVWGAPGVVYTYQEPDARDPNYDEAAQGDTVYATVVPELEEEELKKNVHPMVLEYFEHGDPLEVLELLRGLNLGGHKAAVPSVAVALSLEGKASHRELTSRLLSDLVGKVLSAEDMAAAFDGMLRDLPDLILDTPEAPQMLGQFIARAVADHALPLNFLERYKGRVDCEHARAALDRAAVLLRIKQDVNRLDNVWGVGGGQRPVKHLIKEMNLLLREYLLSGEVPEAEHCLRQLEVPHFHHELVYEAVLMVLESSGETAVTMMTKLLKVLWETGLVTLDQMNRGFRRVYEELGDISLDVPLAHNILERLVDLCFEEGVITKQLRDACPARGRKRFVSEGDGGQIKQ
ncbi:programmed cell death protein 4-like [Paroedura picta]|uniref:programmed cell death protein 4-like n=1 Tax=Paroedura picta TaxID=143630 RepID=UPI004056BF6D